MKNKHNVIVVLLTLIVAAFANLSASAGNDIQTSEAVKTILRQTEQTFIRPGTSINQVSYRDPVMFATFVGLTMQRQNIYLNELRDVEDLQRMTVLGSEIMEMLSKVAEFLEYKNPADGSPLSAEELRSTFLHAFSGDYNQMFIEKGFDPATMNVPYMISQVPLPPQSPGEDAADGGHGRLQVKKPEGIELLGEAASAAESDLPPPYVGTPPLPEPVVISENCQCRPMQPGNKDLVVHQCGGGGYTKCYYFENGKLASQHQNLTGKMHQSAGTQIVYEMEAGIYYMREKYFLDMNGKKHRVLEQYDVTESGQVYLSHWVRYDHGLALETKSFRMQPNYGHFMYSHDRYNPATGRRESVKR